MQACEERRAENGRADNQKHLSPNETCITDYQHFKNNRTILNIDLYQQLNDVLSIFWAFTN